MTSDENVVGASRETAEQSARQWLGLVDARDYEQSWHSGSAYLKSQIGLGSFAEALSQAHNAWVAPADRELTSSRAATELPSAPAGKYWVFEFSGGKAGAAAVTERLTLVQEDEGEWAVAGYYLV